MKYFITEQERTSTDYHEWKKGEFTGKYWANDSLLLSDNTLINIKMDEFLERILPDYDPYENYVLSKELWDLIEKEALNEGGEIFECIEEAKPWAKQTFQEYNCITIIGV